MNRKIILQQHRDNEGHSDGDTLITQAEVFANVSVPSLTFRSRLSSMGLDTSLTALVWRSEFDKAPYTHAVVDGTAYRIADTGAGRNDLSVLLMLERS